MYYVVFTIDLLSSSLAGIHIMAKSVKALITPEVLKWARERRIRLDIDLAAEKLKIDPERLTDWESGKDQPTFAQLKKIANIYKTHVSIFYLPKPPTDFHPLTDYRVLPQTTTPDNEQTYRLKANILEAFDRRETLIEFYELLEMPFPEGTLKIKRNESPTHASEKIRKFLNINTDQLPRTKDRYKILKFWKRTVEAKGILVCQTSANTHLSVELNTFRGFCIAQKPFPVIVVNSQDSPNGRIFTILHELVHIALGESIIQNMKYEDASFQNVNPVEVFCNQVAAEVLVPEKELLAIVEPPFNSKLLTEASQHFGVSIEVIMRRLLTLKKITRRMYQTFRIEQQKYNETDQNPKGFPHYHTRLLNATGEYFARTAFSAYYEDKITLADLTSVFSNCATKHIFKIESAIFK